METITKTYTLNNVWQVTFKPGTVDDEDGTLYTILVSVSCHNGNRIEERITGQVKRDGCCDWGFGQPIVLHFCGRSDASLFDLIFADAAQIYGSESEIFEECFVTT